MTDFSFKNILWQSTLKINLIRAVVAGFVWTVIAVIMGQDYPWLGVIAVPVSYFLFFLPLGIISNWLRNQGVPYVWMLSFITGIMVMPADPIVYLIHKSKPGLLPVKEYPLIEPAIVFWVYDEKTI